MTMLTYSSGLWQGGLYMFVPASSPIPGNLAPIAAPDYATAVAGEAVTINVLANDTDPEGLPLTVTAASAMHGSVSIVAGGLSYVAEAGFVGTDTITYTLADVQGATSIGTVSVDVRAPAPSKSSPSRPARYRRGGRGQDNHDRRSRQRYRPRRRPTHGNRGLGRARQCHHRGRSRGSHRSRRLRRNRHDYLHHISDPGSATSFSSVVVEVRSISLSIENSPDGTFYINTETDELEVRITEPALYRCERTLALSDLEAGPINLVPPTVAGSAQMWGRS